MFKHSGGTGRATSINLGERDFVFVVRLTPDRDAAEAVKECSPQERYLNLNAASLHKHGHGTFCNFRISAPKGWAGVYALVVGDAVRYIGECEDLGKRFNMGYGNISPQNCYKGGQPTNCKINRRVLDVAKAGRGVDLYFCPTQQRKAVEKQLIARYAPPWND